MDIAIARSLIRRSSGIFMGCVHRRIRARGLAAPVARREPARLRVEPRRRGRRDPAGRGRLLEPDPAHARAGAVAGIAPLVARRPPDRLRFVRRGRLVGHLDDRRRWRSLRRLTSSPAAHNMPTWSHDGRFVYFTSDRGGAETIWRAPVAGGPEEQATHTGGGRCEEAAKRPDALLPARHQRGFTTPRSVARWRPGANGHRLRAPLRLCARPGRHLPRGLRRRPARRAALAAGHSDRPGPAPGHAGTSRA
jgi:hypothetical protein